MSSTGTCSLTQRLGMPSTEATRAYAIVIQVGAIAAVLGLYRGHIARMLRGLAGRDEAGRRLLINLAVAFVPAAVPASSSTTRSGACSSALWPVAAAWLVGASRSSRSRASSATARPARGLDALTRAGRARRARQCAALWPGTSRSLAAIVGGLLVGLELTAAVEFSFLLGLLTLAAAAGYKTLKSGPR